MLNPAGSFKAIDRTAMHFTLMKLNNFNSQLTIKAGRNTKIKGSDFDVPASPFNV